MSGLGKPHHLLNREYRSLPIFIFENQEKKYEHSYNGILYKTLRKIIVSSMIISSNLLYNIVQGVHETHVTIVQSIFKKGRYTSKH